MRRPERAPKRRVAVMRLVLVGILILATDSTSLTAAEAGTAVERVSQPVTLVIAHRGDSKVAPENTLPAFVSAVGAGADLVELDYFHSADGVPVVLHDKTLDRTTDARALWGSEKIPITSKRLAELRQLDAGKWFSARFAGTRIPTLDEALDAIQAGSMTLIERKGGDPATCVELLKKKNLIDKVVVQAFDWDYLAGCRKLSADVTMAALGDKELTRDRLDHIAKTGASIVAWDEKSTNASTIAAIHARGWKAWVWTVDSPARVAELVAAKIDGIITNRPAETRAAVRTAQASR